MSMVTVPVTVGTVGTVGIITSDDWSRPIRLVRAVIIVIVIVVVVFVTVERSLTLCCVLRSVTHGATHIGFFGKGAFGLLMGFLFLVQSNAQ